MNANKELIAIFEQKIKDRIAKVWGEEKQEKTAKVATIEKPDLKMVAEEEVPYATQQKLF